jgi:hypothetical protein
MTGETTGRAAPWISTGLGDLHIGHKNFKKRGLTRPEKLLYSCLARRQTGKSGVINLRPESRTEIFGIRH